MNHVSKVLVWVCVFTLTGAILVAWPVQAQLATGTISGVVTDPTDAVVPGTRVVAQNVETGISRETQTNLQGIYSFPALPVGQYTIRAEQTGFVTVVKRDLKLDVDRTLRVDITLEVGAVQETVEVVAGATQLLKPETSDLGQVINEETVENLPLNGREFWTLALLSAGVSEGQSGLIGPVFGFRSLSANGQRADANLFLVDGFDNREMDANQDQITPNLDSIAEFAVHTNTYSATLGSAAGAIVSVQTKSGANDFHGSFFEFFRNDALDATNFFVNRIGLGKDPLRFNQFGGSIGGPIARDKTFFFSDYQGDRVSRGSVLTTTVPTLARRNGDFSDLLAGPNPIQLLHPLTFTPILGNIIDPAIMDPPARALAQLYPEPNLPGTRLNFAAVLTNKLRRDAFSARVDHVFSPKDTLSVRYYYLFHDATTPVAFGRTLGGPPVLGGTDTSKRHSITLSEIHQFTPTIINEFRAGWNYGPRDLLNTDFDDDPATEFGIPNITINDTTRGLPWILFTAGGSDFIGSSLVMPQFLGSINYELKDTLTIQRGKHKIQIGADLVRRHFDIFQVFFPRGFYLYLGFSSFFTSGQFAPGADVADFLLGVPFTVQRDYMEGPIGLRTYQFAAFAQDDIKVSPRLTLNLGVRYDVFPPWLESHNRISNFEPATGTLIPAPDSEFGRRLVQTDANNISPRLGFSYALTGDAKTLLRGGFGLFYFDITNPSSTFSKLVYNAPNYYFQSGPSYPFAPSLATGFPIAPPPPLDNPSGTVLFHPTDNVTSYTAQWNLNLQREIPGNTFVEVGYVGTRGLHLPRYLNLNQPFLDASGNRARVYGDAITGLKTWTSSSRSHYHGLQAKAERRLTRGVQFLASYTFSKSTDDGSSGAWTGNIYPQDNFNRDNDWALSDFDVRNRLVISYIWEIPFFRLAENRFLRTTLGGWQLNGITTFQDGQPFTPAISGAQAGLINPLFNDPTVTDIGSLRPNLVGDPTAPAGGRTIDQWFNADAFDWMFPNQPHNEGTFGNAGRNILKGPGLMTTDLSFFKEIHPTEGWTVQFRAELFNAFNRTNFDLPSNVVNLEGAGRIVSSRPAREIQFGLKITF